MTTIGFHARAKATAGPVLTAVVAACLPIAMCSACVAAQARAAGPDARVWVPAMKKVHARFKGQRGTFALFGDSITVSRAFWFGLQHTRKNADAGMLKAFERVKSYMLEDCWDRRGPEYGNQGQMTIRWAHENVDAWLKRLYPEVALIMFGTNDLGAVKLEEYEAKTRHVVEKCLDNGTIVILSTIPPKHGQAEKAAVFAEAVRKIARDLKVPLTDYHAEILKRRPDDWDGAMEKFSRYEGYDVPTLISRDGVHPSNPRKYANDYSAEGLRNNGYALRSYLALMKYAEVIEKVLPGKPDAPIVPHEAIKLFNGRDLSGWTTWLVDTKRRDPRGVYSVRDGMIRISGDGFGYLSTDRAYQDYRLVVELKWGAQNFRTRKGMARDSGIFLHSAGPEGGSYDCGWGSRRSNTGRDISSGAYKAAIECQVMEGGFGDLLLIHGRYSDGRHVPVRVTVPVAERRVAADYAKYQYDPRAARQMLRSGAIAWIDKDTAWQDVPGFRGRSDVESPHGKWTRVECVCAGDRITVLVNGKRVNEASDVFPTAGKILLQCEGSEVFFRKIELHPVIGSAGMNGPLRIVALGDSITNGVGLAKVTEADTFRDVVRRELIERLGSKVEVVNAGVNGDIVTLAIKRLKRDVLDRKPDIVTIMFGGNEAGFYRPETGGFADTPRVGRDEFKATLGKIVDRVRAEGITVVLMTCPPMTDRYGGMHLDAYQKHGINFLVKDYAQTMRDVAAEKGVELIDVYRAFQQNPSTRDYFPDGLHPDARGHRVIADLLVPRLARIIGRRPPVPEKQ